MIGNSMLIRRGLPVALVIAAAIMLQPRPASAGGYFSLSFGAYYPYHGYHHGHHPYRAYYAWPYPAWRWAPVLTAESRRTLERTGAVKLKVNPKKTDVFVDGRYAGRTGKFDGYPGYLWLEAGRHTLTFHKEGYRTLRQVVEVRPGGITDVRFAMIPGQATPPEPPAVSAAPPPPARPPAPEREPATAPTTAEPTAPRSGRIIVGPEAEGGRLRLSIEPDDASVYLDGRFLGTGTEIARLHDGILIEAGEHMVEVVHPRHEARRVSFRVGAGEELEVRIALELLAGRSG